MSDSNSLMARIFKSKYFPRSSISKSNVGFQPSYAWRSLLKAREMVENDARWVIGNGRSVQIFKDKWIPGMHNTLV